MLRKTAENFDIKEIYADKAYATLPNYEVFIEHGVTPYIAFKSNHTGDGGRRSGKSPGRPLWWKMIHLFQLDREEFLAHYHQRNNVEAVFSMIKAKFGDRVRSKTETAALNEVLCKIVSHDLCVLISAMFEFGVDLDHLLPQRPRVLQVIPGGLSEAPC